VIVEDDYDGEFRYHGQPVESMQGLDTEGRVVYIGTFSRTVFPALRIGYLVSPRQLAPAFTAAKWLCDRHTATLEQETLAEFIAMGAYEQHLRRARKRNASRLEAMLEAIQKHVGDRAAVTGAGSGTHLVLWPRTGGSELQIVTRAAERGAGIYGISPYYLSAPSAAGVLLGFANLNERAIREGIRILAGALDK
jgi:GntR family transcriptional regulator/MocR family aminotransferase